MSKARELAQKPNQPTGRKNLIVNGAMNVAQRGTSTSSVASSGYYSVDRFRFGRSAGTFTISQEDDGPEGFGHSYKILTTSAASELAGNYQIFEYRFEGQDLQQMQKGSSAAKTVTLSFYVKSNVTGNYQVNLRDVNNTRQVGSAFSVDASATWEKKTITFPADTTGSFDNDSGSSMIVEWWLGSGSTFQGGTMPTSWESSLNVNRAANVNVDLSAAVNNYFQITGVQLEVGSVATEFEHRSFGEELALCQRYYQYSDFTGSTLGLAGRGSSSTDVSYIAFPTKVEMRTSPSLTFSGGWETASSYAGTLSSYHTTSNIITARGSNTMSGPTVRWVRGGTIFVDAEL